MTGETIGFIGLGAMGVGMSKNLLDAGYSVCGYDVDGDAMAKLVDAGGTAATSPALVAADVSLLIVCVFSAEQAEAALYGENGAAETLPKGVTVVMCTTMAPEQAREMAGRLEASGHLFIDAPVTGGKRGADDGTLTVIASGSDAAMAAADGAFKAMGGRIYRVGDVPGAGSTVKMINQLLVGVHVVAAAEAMALATKAGADPQTVYDVITHGGGNSVAFESRVPYILTEDYAPRGVVDIFVAAWSTFSLRIWESSQTLPAACSFRCRSRPPPYSSFFRRRRSVTAARTTHPLSKSTSSFPASTWQRRLIRTEAEMRHYHSWRAQFSRIIEISPMM